MAREWKNQYKDFLKKQKLKPLTNRETRKRIFIIGSAKAIQSFVDHAKAQYAYKGSCVEKLNYNNLKKAVASINFRYPMRGCRIFELLQKSTKDLIEENKDDHRSHKNQNDAIEQIYTHQDPYYNISKLQKATQSFMGSQPEQQEVEQTDQKDSVNSSNTSTNANTNTFIETPQNNNNNQTLSDKSNTVNEECSSDNTVIEELTYAIAVKQFQTISELQSHIFTTYQGQTLKNVLNLMIKNLSHFTIALDVQRLIAQEKIIVSKSQYSPINQQQIITKISESDQESQTRVVTSSQKSFNRIINSSCFEKTNNSRGMKIEDNTQLQIL